MDAKNLCENIVVSEKPYKKNSRTAPEFLMTAAKVFTTEKERLIAYMNAEPIISAIENPTILGN